MHVAIHLTRKRLALLAALAILGAAGAAYATIPDSSGVYTACALKSVGTIRLIDPSLGAGSLLGHCTQLESQITWNRQGQNGTSPTVAQLGTGDPHCAAGGASLTDASGNVAYVCNGQNGVDGKSFDGTFTSPNGQFSLSVADGGVSVSGPGSSIDLSPNGDLTITAAGDENLTVGHDETTHVGHDRTETVGRNETITVHSNRTEKVDQNETIDVGGNRSDTVDANETSTVGINRTETVGGNLATTASFATINGVGGCRPAARLADLVSSVQIVTGSTTVCIGG
jgi:hypothetical protein